MGEAEDAGGGGGGAARAGDAFHCSLCGRDFPSCKALYGHMRSHPEREWRGINPPPGARIPVRAPPPTPARSGGENPPRPPSPRPALSSWSTTQRRGRKGSKQHSPFRSFCSIADIDPVATAVYGLMWISRERVAGDLRFAQPQKGPDEKIIVSGETEAETAGACGGVLQSETGEINDETGKHDGGGGDDDVAERRKKKGKIGEPEALQEFKPAGKSSRRYRCTACNKFFPTHQALGGHMASHKKDKGGGPELELASCGGGELPAAAPPCAEKPSIPPAARISAPVTEHRCDKCDMAFPTGQALGGHKRKHWHGHDSSASFSSAAPTPPPPPRENPQRNPPIGAERCCSEAATGKGRAVPRCRAPPEPGNPSSGPSVQLQPPPPQKFPEPGPSAAPAPAAAAAPRPPEKEGNGRQKSADDANDQEQASSPSPSKHNSRIVLGKLHDFDLNEKPKDSGDEVGF